MEQSVLNRARMFLLVDARETNKGISDIPFNYGNRSPKISEVLPPIKPNEKRGFRPHTSQRRWVRPIIAA